MKGRIVKIFITYLLFYSLLFSQLSIAAGGILPTDRWSTKSYTGGAYSSDIVTPNIDPSTLPVLKGDENNLKEGLRAGDFELKFGDRTLVVDQKTNKILAVWDSFNIGSDSSVEFVQPNNESVAVNLIDQQSPSTILGNLKANGSVYLINPNGIIFGENSKVDVRGLVAAAMELNGFDMDHHFSSEEEKQAFIEDSLLDSIANGEAFLVNAKAVAEGTDDLPRIVIKSGAEINSGNAPVLIAAPEVINDGSINSNNGQVVLAGSRKEVYLAVSDEDPNLRGYLVEVDSGESDERGAVVNAGKIQANLGNVTLIASDILQAGKIKATTAIDANGSIRIVARDKVEVFDVAATPNSHKSYSAAYIDDKEDAPSVGKFAVGSEAGKVVFTESSETEILPQELDTDSVERFYDSLTEKDKQLLGGEQFLEKSEQEQLAGLELIGTPTEKIDNLKKPATDSLNIRQSKIDVEGREVTLAQGAKIKATSGEVSISAKEKPLSSLESEPGSTARLTIQDGALIDVSGDKEAVLGEDRNTVEIFVTSSEIKDVTDQKGGELLRQTVSVDVVEGTEVLDWESSLESVEKSIHEHLKNGGEVDIKSTGVLEIGNNATIDASAGYASFLGGNYQTSKVLVGGKIVDISEAPAGTPIANVFPLNSTFADDPKWGNRPTYSPIAFLFSNAKKRDPYIEGGKAGSIEIASNQLQMASDVSLLVNGNPGTYQRTAEGAVLGGDISINLSSLATGTGLRNVNITSKVDEVPVEENLTLLSTKLIAGSGAKNFDLKARGHVEIEGDSPIRMDNQGSLDIESYTLGINSDIRLVGGDLNLNVEDHTTLDAIIDTSGEWVNDSFDKKLSTSTVSIDAGTVDISSTLDMSSESVIRANAGAWLDQEQRVRFGTAGDIKIGDENSFGQFAVGNRLDGKFEALDFASGGTLTLVANSISISDLVDSNSFLGDAFVLNDDFFEQKGVNNFSLTARNGSVVVVPGSQIFLDNEQLRVADLQELREYLSADNVDDVLIESDLFDYEKVGASLEFKAFLGSGDNLDRGQIVFANDASLIGIPGSSVSFIAEQNITLAGNVKIPGGDVQLQLASIEMIKDGKQRSISSINEENFIYLPDTAFIDVSADVIPIDNVFGLNKFKVFDAGSVTLDAQYGYLVTAQNSEVRSAGAIVNQEYAVGNRYVSVPQSLSSGQVYLSGQSGMSLGGRLNFGTSEEGYRGGLVSVSLSNEEVSFGAIANQKPTTQRLELVGESQRERFSDSNSSQVYLESIAHLGQVDTTQFSDLNLASLDIKVKNSEGANVEDDLANTLDLVDDISLAASESINLNVSTLNLNDSKLNLQSPYVRLGGQGGKDFDRLSIFEDQEKGLGSINIDATLVDFAGNLSVNDDANIVLNSDLGIRFNSVFNQTFYPTMVKMHGDVVANSPKVWVSSLSIGDWSSDQSITLNSDGQNDSPILSAGGELNINAKDIYIDTTLEVPFGSIGINAENLIDLGQNAKLKVGSEQTVLLGNVLAKDVFWFYNPNENRLNTVPTFNSPEDYPFSKSIKLNGEALSAVEGSVVDVSAGGGIWAREFVAGLKGSYDFFKDNPTTKQVDNFYENRFVILPEHQSGFAPSDINELKGTGIDWGQMVEIAGSDLVADGVYTVLPVSYALLPGAVIVSAGPKTQYVSEGANYISQAGRETVSARFVSQDDQIISNWKYLQIEPNSNLDNYAHYNILSAQSFVKGAAQGTNPLENGGLSLNIGQTLQFDGELISSSLGSQAAYFDLTSKNDIKVVADLDDAGEAENTLLVDDDLFQGLSNGSVLLGGQRSKVDDFWVVDDSTTSERVTFDSVSIETNELVVAARQGVSLENNSLIKNSGEGFESTDWKAVETGTMLVSSSNPNARIGYTENTQLGGLNIESGSSLESNGAVLVAYDGQSTLDKSNIKMDGGKLQIITDSLMIGNKDEDSGVALTNDLLTSLSSIDLRLNNTLEFVSDSEISVDNFSLTANSLIVTDNKSVDINAVNSVSLQGLGLLLDDVNSAGSKLNITSKGIRFEGGDEEGLSVLNIGAEVLNLNANQEMSFSGESLISQSSENGTFSISSPIITSSKSSSALDIKTDGGLTILGRDTLVDISDDINHFGSDITLSGNSVFIDSIVDGRAGNIDITAGDNGLRIGNNGKLLLSAFELATQDGFLASEYGELSLVSDGALEIIDLTSLDYSGSQSGESSKIKLVAGQNLNIGSSSETSGLVFGNQSDLFVQAESLSAETLAVLNTINNQGGEGDLSIHLTVLNDFTLNGSWKSRHFDIANYGGSLSMVGSLESESGYRASSLLAADNLNIAAGSSISVLSSELEYTPLELASANGAIVIDGTANIDVSDNIQLFLNGDDEAIAQGQFQLDNVQSISHIGEIPNIDVYVRSEFQASELSEDNLRGDLSSFIDTAVSTASDLRPKIMDKFSESIDKSRITIRPHLDIYGAGSIELGDSGNTVLDISNLRSQEGEAGLFSIRALNGITLTSGVSDGVSRSGVSYDGTQFHGVLSDNLNDAVSGHVPIFEENLVLQNTESSSISMSNSSYEAAILGYSNKLKNDLFDLKENAFVRTGTGDIKFSSSGALTQGVGAYITTLGSTKLDDDQLPMMGDMPFVSLSEPSAKLLNEQFGGFSTNAGNTRIIVGGDLKGVSETQSWNHYLSKLDIDEYSLVPGIVYENLSLTFASIERMTGGIHSIGGGDIDLEVGGDLETLALSTPGNGYQIGEPGSESAQSEYHKGGNIFARVRGDVSNVSMQIDDGSFDLSVGGAITGDEEGRAILLGYSDADIEISAKNGIELTGLVNTPISLYDTAHFTSLVGPQSTNIDKFGKFYFDGLDSSNLSLTTFGGDVVLVNNPDALDAYYDSELSSRFNDKSDFDSYLKSHQVLPSSTSLTSLASNVIFESKPNIGDSTTFVTVFPNANAILNVVAQNSILSTGRVYVWIPDFSTNAAPSLEEAKDKVEVIKLFDDLGIFVPNLAEVDRRLNHSSNLVDRGDLVSLSLTAVEGNIGDESTILRFNAPTAIDVEAGGSILNTAFSFQHLNSSDISRIAAKEDFLYPFFFNSDGLIENSSREQVGMGVTVGGGGDLIVQVGGKINLGTSNGIRSIGNIENPNLSSDGAALHIYSGVEEFGELAALFGTVLSNNEELFANSGLELSEVDSKSFIEIAYNYFSELNKEAEENDGFIDERDYSQLTDLAQLMGLATDKEYEMINGELDFSELVADLDQQTLAFKNQLIVTWFAQTALTKPEVLDSRAEQLFTLPEAGTYNLTDESLRTEVFQTYLSNSNKLLALMALLDPGRQQTLVAASTDMTIEQIVELPAYEQINIAIKGFNETNEAEQLLVAEQVMNAQMKQSGIEGSKAGVALAKFERGITTQRIVFGESYDFALKWMATKSDIAQLKFKSTATYNELLEEAKAFKRGEFDQERWLQSASAKLGLEFSDKEATQLALVVEASDSLTDVKLGGPGEEVLANVDQVFEFWEKDSGLDFSYDPNAEDKGDISMLYTTIQTRSGGDINLYAPTSSIDVGQSAQQVATIYGGESKAPKEDRLGILSFGKGDINSFVADAFNVNESRTIPLLGGDVNVWSAFGDIDAGRGSKTALATPETTFQISQQSGLITAVKAAPVSGSGISTRKAPEIFKEFSSPSERFQAVSVGAGQAVLTTPFGIVDAGEAGIQSAGDLFIAAQEVVGADNISAGGLSTGVPVTTAISSDIGGLGSAVDAATSSLQEAAESAAANSAQQNAAFVTIELL